MVLLFGCAEVKTLEELELAAIQSGDWSAVEKREQSMARRKARRGPSCPSGSIAVCEVRGGDRQCQCASDDSFRRLFDNY
jgi:hypothetical protein